MMKPERSRAARVVCRKTKQQCFILEQLKQTRNPSLEKNSNFFLIWIKFWVLLEYNGTGANTLIFDFKKTSNYNTSSAPPDSVSHRKNFFLPTLPIRLILFCVWLTSKHESDFCVGIIDPVCLIRSGQDLVSWLSTAQLLSKCPIMCDSKEISEWF